MHRIDLRRLSVGSTRQWKTEWFNLVGCRSRLDGPCLLPCLAERYRVSIPFVYQMFLILAEFNNCADRMETRGPDWAVWALAPLAISASLAVSIPSPAYGRSATIAAVFPPWWQAARIYEAAVGAGPLLDAGQASFVMIVGFSDPGVAERLRSAGAIILLDAAAVGCAPSEDGKG
jgi:hypothetical protein